MNIKDIDDTVYELNRALNAPMLDKHGECTAWFLLATDGINPSVTFLGNGVWDQDLDEREEDESQPDGKEPLKQFLIRQAKDAAEKIALCVANL